MTSIIQKNRVVILAFISAITLVLQQALATNETDWKVIGFAALIALIGTVANQFKGKGLTILGILATLAGSFTTIWETGTFTWNEFILSSIVAVLLAAAQSLQPEISKK